MDETHFCGSNLSNLPSSYAPKSKEWKSSDYLVELKRADILLTDLELESKRDFFYHATFTEFDAENLCRYLESLNQKFSNEFLVFEKIWRRDEWNHYVGFRHLYSTMFNLSICEVAQQIESRPYDFSLLKDFFEDEFLICLLIAYDEILTTKSYGSELALYTSLGCPKIYDWFRNVTRDEAYHFNNVMEVIRLNHFERIYEIPKVIDSFINWDQDGNKYGGTFVLDHEFYAKEFIAEGGEIIKNYFSRNLYSKNK